MSLIVSVTAGGWCRRDGDFMVVWNLPVPSIGNLAARTRSGYRVEEQKQRRKACWHSPWN